MAFIILPIDTMNKRLTMTADSQPISLACSINLGNRIPQMWQTYDPTRWLQYFTCPCDTFQKTIWESAPRQCLGKKNERMEKNAEADWIKFSSPTTSQMIQSVNQVFSLNHNIWMNKQMNKSINFAVSRCLNVGKPTFKTRPSNLIPSHW